MKYAVYLASHNTGLGRDFSYGLWCGKSYRVNNESFPVCYDSTEKADSSVKLYNKSVHAENACSNCKDGRYTFVDIACVALIDEKTMTVKHLVGY